MKTITSTLMALALGLMLAAPAMAARSGAGEATVTFRLTVNTSPGKDQVFLGFYAAGSRSGAQQFHLYCGDLENIDHPVKGPSCAATTYTWTSNVPIGTRIVYAFMSQRSGKEESTRPGNSTYFHEGDAVVNRDTVIAASSSELDQPMVTKTVQLTLNGVVPDNQLFVAAVGPFPSFTGSSAAPPQLVALCGKGPEGLAGPACKGNGTVFTASVQVPKGSTRVVQWVTANFNAKQPKPTVFYQTTEQINSSMTDTAWYTYGPGMPNTGAGGTAGNALPYTGLAALLTLLGLGAVAHRSRART